MTYQLKIHQAPLGIQMLLIAFGALVLVPILTGLDPNVALFTAGLGTLIFQGVTRGRVPVFLGSSFAFIGPIIYGAQTWGLAATLSGLMTAGFLYVLLSLLVWKRGSGVLERVLPPIVTGPVIMLIGLMLAPVAVNFALGKTGDGTKELFPEHLALLTSMASLMLIAALNLWGRGMIRLLAVFLGAIGGYAIACMLGMVDFSTVYESAWFRVPQFIYPEWNWQAALFMFPVAIAPAIEHFGDILAIRSVTGDDYLKNPGIHRTLLGDGLATVLASCLGGPPNTTYSEVTGGVALTGAKNPGVMTWAALFAISMSFVGKVGAILRSIPTPVMGGVLILLFGAIVVVGIHTIQRARANLLAPRNMIIVGMILVFGVGGMTFSAGEFKLKGIAMAGLLGVLLNLVLPKPVEES